MKFWRRRRASHSSARLARTALILITAPAIAQETTGQAEFSFQGFYLGGKGEQGISTTGGSLFLQHHYRRTRFQGRLENYRDKTGISTGENYVSLEGLPWRGYRWNFRAGDYRLLIRPSGASPSNLWFPDVLMRGGRIDMTGGSWTAFAFGGVVTVMQGPRVPYLRPVPQRLGGAGLLWKRSENLQAQVMALQITANLDKLSSQTFYLVPGRLFRSSSQAIGNVSWRPAPHLKLFGEAGISTAPRQEGARSNPGKLSTTLSAEYEGTRLDVRANYVRQANSLLPLAGYFVGDRSGPFAEFRYSLTKRITLFGNAAMASNNLDRNPQLPSLQSRTLSGGSSVELPGRILLMGNLSSIRLRTASPGASAPLVSANRLSMLSAMRTIGRHSLRVGWREIRIAAPEDSGKIRSFEVDDSYGGPFFTLSGGARLDSRLGRERRDSLMFRGSMSMNTRRVSGYFSMEAGRDLANETLFVMSQTRSAIAGLSAQVTRQWTFSVEAVRNTILSELNPQNVFLLSNTGTPLWAILDAMNRWTVYFRLSRTFRWGKPLPRPYQNAATDELFPVMGVIEGWVLEGTAAGPAPVAGIPVALDGSRLEVTDAEGRFRFADVPQGRHLVALPPRELPAEFDAASAPEVPVQVFPRRIARAEFRVIRLTSVFGKFVSAREAPFTSIIVRLAGTARYTTPDEEGNFTFYNLPSGDYQLVIDLSAMPRPYRLSTPDRIPVRVRPGEETPLVLIGLEEAPVKPAIREVQVNVRLDN